MKNEGKRFASGVLMLTLAGAAVKLCGLLFRIPLVSVIGKEGMGYFSSAYVIYTFFYVLSSSGLPVGLSLLVAGSPAYAEKKRFFRAALTSFGALGILCGALLTVFCRHAARLICNEGAELSIGMMGPTLAFVCLSGTLRGYFQGKKQMLPTAVSQMIEAVFKTALGVLFAVAAVKKGFGAKEASAAALFGVLAAAVCRFSICSSGIFSLSAGRRRMAAASGRRPTKGSLRRCFPWGRLRW